MRKKLFARRACSFSPDSVVGGKEIVLALLNSLRAIGKIVIGLIVFKLIVNAAIKTLKLRFEQMVQILFNRVNISASVSRPIYKNRI